MKWKNWKKNLVAAGVLVTVCSGIYLNWLYSGGSDTKDLTDTLDAEKVMSDDLLVLGDDSLQAGSDELDTMSDYFAAVRLSRQQARDSAIALLREAAESETADVAVANEAAETIQVLAGYALAEAQIENLVTAKGYADCVAFMGDGAISVVVEAEGGLQAEDVAKITEIVLSETDYTTGQITVLEAN